MRLAANTEATMQGTKAGARRELAGRVVRDEIGRAGRTVERTARDARMAPSTLYRILLGEVEPESTKLRAVEGVLHLTDDLLKYVIDGDQDAIRALGTDEIRPGLRRVILTQLAQIETAQDYGGTLSSQTM